MQVFRGNFAKVLMFSHVIISEAFLKTTYCVQPPLWKSLNSFKNKMFMTLQDLSPKRGLSGLFVIKIYLDLTHHLYNVRTLK